MIQYQLPIVLSSSVASGATNKTADGSSFQINLENPLLIPKEAHNCFVVCQAAEIWNTSPNILTGVNDKLYLSDGSGSLVITIPQGLYDINLLNLEINRQIVTSGRTNDSLVIIGNSATQKTIISLLNIGTSIDFTQSDTFREVLGFDSQVIGPSTVANELVYGENVAAFNNIDYFIIHSDLVNLGIRINSKYSQAIAQVLINAPTGSQIIHQPQNPPQIPAPNLVGEKKNNIRCWLTDQDNNLVNTANEDWSFRIVIHYQI
jgi:hypothetical protein